MLIIDGPSNGHRSLHAVPARPLGGIEQSICLAQCLGQFFGRAHWHDAKAGRHADTLWQMLKRMGTHLHPHSVNNGTRR